MSKLKNILTFVVILILNQQTLSGQNGVKLRSFHDCEFEINLNSCFDTLASINKLTFIFVRAESSTDPNAKIEPLNKYILLDNIQFADFISFELAGTKNGTDCHAKVLFENYSKSLKINPPSILITCKNVGLLTFFGKICQQNGVELKPYQYDPNDRNKTTSKFLYFDGYSGKKSFYELSNKVISLLDDDFIDKYYSSQFDSINLYLDSLNTVLMATNLKYTDLNDKNLELLKSINSNNSNLVEFYFSSNISQTCLNSDNFSDQINSNYNLGYNMDLVYYSIKDIKWLGFGLGLNHQNTTGQLTNQNFIDTLPEIKIDRDNDYFRQVVYGENLTENYLLRSLSLSPQIYFRFPQNSKFNLMIIPGLKITHFLNSTYKFTSGTLSYGAIYPSYSQDTIFSGMYDNVQDIAPISITQNLKLNPTVLSLNLPIYINFNLSQHVGISLGGYFEYGLTNILNSDQSDKILSYNPNTINSTLYRYDELKIRRYGISLGLNYRF